MHKGSVPGLHPATPSDTCWLYREPLEPTTTPPSHLISNNIFHTSKVSFSHYASFLRHSPSGKEHQHQQQYPISKPTDTSTDPSATAVRLTDLFIVSYCQSLGPQLFLPTPTLDFFTFLFFLKSQNLSKWVAVATTKKLPFRISEDLRSNLIATGPSSRKIFRISKPSTASTSTSTTPTTTNNNKKQQCLPPSNNNSVAVTTAEGELFLISHLYISDIVLIDILQRLQLNSHHTISKHSVHCRQWSMIMATTEPVSIVALLVFLLFLLIDIPSFTSTTTFERRIDHS